MTLQEAKSVKLGQVLYSVIHKNADGSPQRWRVNGRIKTWKKSPERIQIPVKYGLRHYDYVTEKNLSLLELTERKAYGRK